MNKRKNIFGVLGLLLVILFVGYMIFTAKEMGI